MNGNVVKRWEGYNNSAGGPARVLPGGVVMAASGARPPHQESLELDPARLRRQRRLAVLPQRANRDARGRHDLVGAPAPRLAAGELSGRLLLTREHARDHRRQHADPDAHQPNAAERSPTCCSKTIGSSRCRRNGDIVWEWVASDHIDEFGFAADARKAIKAAPRLQRRARQLRLAAHQLGDLCRAEPVVRPGRQALRARTTSSSAAARPACSRSSAATARSSGGSVRTSAQSKELRAIRQIIGQHHAHLIPKGLPGAGNLLVFDNGGASGYGFANPIAPDGSGAFARATSRVLEINPVTLELVWSYTESAVLQHEHQQRAATAERQHADHRRAPADGCSR